MKLFLSHIAEEADIARALKEHLERALDVDVFVSGTDVPLGASWVAWLNEAMTGAERVLVLCSPLSFHQPWILFESGGGWGKSGKVITLCHAGLSKSELTLPLSSFQGLDLDSVAACRSLVSDLARQLDVQIKPEFDANAMFDAIAPRPPQRTKIIGIDLAHGQSRWQRGSIFDRPALWTLRSRDDFSSRDFHELGGLVVGMPFNTLMDADTTSAIERWVHAGGHLLLLGFELGDRHHGGNLHELSRRFGIHPNADIVGPPDFSGTKPYGTPVQFDYGDGLALINVQTLSVEPGGWPLIRVGKNHVFRPTSASVDYREGRLVQPRGAEFDRDKNAGSAAVAVEAPRGLCGDGAMMAVGTWMFDDVFWTDLFAWLTGV